MSISLIPANVLLYNLLPILPTCDLLSLACTNKTFAELCNNESLWQRKLLADFNFAGAETARSSGWKFIYKGLDKPQVYVWGDRRNGRLGLSRFPNTRSFGVNVPTRLKLPGVRIVSLVAGGWSFHALDSDGNIRVWGTLNSESMTVRNEGYSEPGQTAYVPMKLSLPSSFRSISCGRMHSSALGANNKIWTFASWGRPFRMACPVFDDPEFVPVQVECGWMFSCVLVESGDVFAWWPFCGTLENRIKMNNQQMDKNPGNLAKGINDIIPCVPWETDLIPVRLPSLPPLPALEETDAEPREGTKLVKIAGFDGHIVGLTNKGHVVKFRGLDNEQTAAQGRWTYLPKFSEAHALREHSIFSDPESDLKAPESLRITHISANYLTFVAYSTGSNSTVLMGNTDTTEESEPRVISALQDRNVISVVLGDYHSAALTADGKLYTWGSFSAGALGLGEDETVFGRSHFASFNIEERTVDVPTEVRFDHSIKGRKDRFCLAVAAAGWHTGALVIDLEPDGSESEEEVVPAPRPIVPPPPRGIRPPGETPPFVPLPSIFRVGLAGSRHNNSGRRQSSGPGSSNSQQGGS